MKCGAALPCVQISTMDICTVVDKGSYVHAIFLRVAKQCIVFIGLKVRDISSTSTYTSVTSRERAFDENCLRATRCNIYVCVYIVYIYSYGLQLHTYNATSVITHVTTLCVLFYADLPQRMSTEGTYVFTNSRVLSQAKALCLFRHTRFVIQCNITSAPDWLEGQSMWGACMHGTHLDHCNFHASIIFSIGVADDVPCCSKIYSCNCDTQNS